MNTIELKSELHRQCVHIVNQRIDTIQKAIDASQETSNEDTKSSAGDKYETTRSMMQLDIEQQSIQLAEALKLKNTLVKIDPEVVSPAIQSGSLVTTDHGIFYLTVSIGSVTIGHQTFVVLSPAAPVGALMMGLQAGNEFIFNKKVFKVLQVA